MRSALSFTFGNIQRIEFNLDHRYVFVLILFCYQWLRQEVPDKQNQLRVRVEIVLN